MVRKETRGRLAKEVTRVSLDKVEFLEREVRKEKQDQEDPLGRVDYREIQVNEVLLVHLDPRVLRVRQEYRGFKA